MATWSLGKKQVFFIAYIKEKYFGREKGFTASIVNVAKSSIKNKHKMKCKSISTWYGKGASMELCCNRRLVDIAGAEMHGLGFNISIKHSSVPSAGKNQSVRLNTK